MKAGGRIYSNSVNLKLFQNKVKKLKKEILQACKITLKTEKNLIYSLQFSPKYVSWTSVCQQTALH